MDSLSSPKVSIRDSLASLTAGTPPQASTAEFFRRPPSRSSIAQDSSYPTFRSSTTDSSSFSPSRQSTAGSFSSALSRQSSATSYDTLFADFSDVPKLVRTPWEADRSKRPLTARRPLTLLAPKPLPAHIFKSLPREIYDCILQQLEQSYFESDIGACTTCYMKDLYNVALTSRAWKKAARRQL